MQIGIDLGATKIEYVLLDNDNKELIRNRVPTPNNYDNTLLSIINIVKDLEKKNNKDLSVGICHPGATDKTTGLIKNAHNSQWLNKKDIVKDLKKFFTYLANLSLFFAIAKFEDPPKTGSVILKGTGRVFSLNPNTGNITKKCKK